VRGIVAKKMRREAERATQGWMLRAWVRGTNRLHPRCTRYVYLAIKNPRKEELTQRRLRDGK
jgi:hypothetical protein